jgi:hypothetical protein
LDFSINRALKKLNASYAAILIFQPQLTKPQYFDFMIMYYCCDARSYGELWEVVDPKTCHLISDSHNNPRDAANKLRVHFIKNILFK